MRHAVMLQGKEAGPVIAGQQEGPTGIPGRQAGATFTALLLFHHSSEASGRD